MMMMMMMKQTAKLLNTTYFSNRLEGATQISPNIRYKKYVTVRQVRTRNFSLGGGRLTLRLYIIYVWLQKLCYKIHVINNYMLHESLSLIKLRGLI